MAIGPDGQAVVPTSGPNAASSQQLARLRLLFANRQLTTAPLTDPTAPVPYLDPANRLRTPWGWSGPSARVDLLKRLYIQAKLHEASRAPVWDLRDDLHGGPNGPLESWPRGKYLAAGETPTPWGTYLPPGGLDPTPEPSGPWRAQARSTFPFPINQPPTPAEAARVAQLAARNAALARILRAHAETPSPITLT